MITRAQEKTLSGNLIQQSKPKLSALEKAMLRWVTVDVGDKVLDASVGHGLTIEYLRRNMLCEVCGVSDSMESVRIARARNRNCDIVYAALGDIPWREDAFDTVLMKMQSEEASTLKRMLGEALRVLKPGGQFILGATCVPIALVKCLPHEMREERHVLPRTDVQEMLADLCYQNITWQRTGLHNGVMIAWKAKGEADP